jgi:hypothetical protein
MRKIVSGYFFIIVLTSCIILFRYMFALCFVQYFVPLVLISFAYIRISVVCLKLFKLSISPTFSSCFYCKKVFCSAFLYLQGCDILCKQMSSHVLSLSIIASPCLSAVAKQSKAITFRKPWAVRQASDLSSLKLNSSLEFSSNLKGLH